MRRYQIVTVLSVAGVLLPGLPAHGTTDEDSGALYGLAIGGTYRTGGLTTDEQPTSGSGTFTEVDLPDYSEPTDSQAPVFKVAITTEDGIPVEPDVFGSTVFDILRHEQGWQDVENVRFVSAPEAEADAVIRLATPDTVDELCAPLQTNGYTSCRNGENVVINLHRWAYGTENLLAAGGSLDDYRDYVINHEIGHSLGHGHDLECLADGKAPIMMQQTLDLRGCTPNGWPQP